jgi:hypothetical protein
MGVSDIPCEGTLGIMWFLGAHFGGCVETKITIKVIVYLVVYTVGLRIWRICGDNVVDSVVYLVVYIVVYIVSLRLCPYPVPHQRPHRISAVGVSTTATIGLELETAVLKTCEAGKAARTLGHMQYNSGRKVAR